MDVPVMILRMFLSPIELVCWKVYKAEKYNDILYFDHLQIS
jgi:hypothetical protein